MNRKSLVSPIHSIIMILQPYLMSVFIILQYNYVKTDVVKVKSLSSVRLFATLRTNYSPPGSSIHGIFQTRILEWVTTDRFKLIKKKMMFYNLPLLAMSNL